ncbi:MAG: SHOCT domain-containing protein [Candidatus Saccharibacteria bacterium]
MKQYTYTLVALSLIGAALLLPGVASANMIIDQNSTTTSSSADEQKGQAIYTQLQNKQTSCAKLTNDDFDVMGDFFLGRMMGSAHDSMDQQMTQHIGANGERQAHIAMGQRLSGCNVNASYPSSASNYPAMAWTGMTGSNGPNDTNGSDWNMMGYRNASWLGSDTAYSLLFAIVAIAGVAAWLYYRPRTASTPLDTIKLRYAKGELTKNEFEQLKNGLDAK